MKQLFQDREDHPSFGMVGISHVSSTGSFLVGSEFRHHHFVSLLIRRASKHRDLSHEWWFAQEELIRISLSEAQFVELMGRPNMGDGVACTLEHVHGEIMPPVPQPLTMKEKFRADLKTDTAECVADLRSAMADLHAAIESGKIGKTALRDIYKKLEFAARAVDSGIPFVEKSFEEAMEKTVNHAATEIEATITQMAMRLGIERLQEIGAAGPKLIEEAK